MNKPWVMIKKKRRQASVMSQDAASWLMTDFLISRFTERRLNSYPEFLAKFPQLLNLCPLLNWRSLVEKRGDQRLINENVVF